jgi:chemotaxis family two-component system response regulator Rcp1
MMKYQTALTKPIDILLVEDNPADVMLTREALKESKISIILNVVMDGEEALLYIKRSGKYASVLIPDLILLDLNLPRKDGLTVLSEIKTDPILRRIPVIMLTTSDSEKDISNTYDNYANCYIVKPSDFRQFVNVIKTIEDFWLNIVKLPKIENKL